MTDNEETITITVTPAEFLLLIDGLDDTLYWCSDEEYRDDMEAHEPYSNHEELRSHLTFVAALRDRLAGPAEELEAKHGS